MRRLCALALLAATAALASPGAPALALEPRYDHSALGASTPSSDDSAAADAQYYARLLALHAVLGFVAFQVVAPLAVVIAAVGKSWGNLWFKAHWRMQLYFVAPATVVSVVIAVVAANGEGEGGEVDLKHKITGYVLLGALSVQALLGFYSHHRQVVGERFVAETGRELPVAKRRMSNWMHMALGVALLTVGGLEVTWGFGLYEETVGEKVPIWVVVVHWVVAGLPVLVVTPFVLIRGFLRLRQGANLVDAFVTPFHSSSSSLTSKSSHQPPRKLFLHSATYLSTPVFDVDLENDKADGVGHAYAPGKGVDGHIRVDSIASTWPGAQTRDEYEAEVASSRAPDSVVDGGVSSSAASFRSFTTLGNDYSRADGADEEGTGLLRADSTWRPSQVAPGAMALYDPAPTTYPPAPAAVTDVSSATPSLPALPPVFSPVSSPAPAPAQTLSTPAVLPGPPAASAVASPLSPRLSFMPFAGPAPAHPPPTSASPAPTSLTVSSAPSLDAHGAVAAAPVLVPTPDALEGRDRHGSFAGEVVDAAARPSRDKLLPLPGEPGSPSSFASSRAAVEDGAGVRPTSEGTAAKEEDGAGVGDDSESMRLMDELERELTISTVRSGRSARSVAPAAAAAAADEAQTGAAAEQEADDEQTRLEREQSGKWLGSNRLSSSS
ncbi:hypothetical protein JCM3775_004690 [Rhodotorula graminis]